MSELDKLLYLAGAGVALGALARFWSWQRQRPPVLASRELALHRDLIRMQPLIRSSSN